MFKEMKKLLIIAVLAASSIVGHAQSITAAELPEYIVISAESTKIFGGIGLTIDSKKSSFKESLMKLEQYIISKDQKEVRTLTDLFNVMNELGFDYVNAFVDSGTNLTGGDNLSLGSEKSKNNIVFKKKKS